MSLDMDDLIDVSIHGEIGELNELLGDGSYRRKVGTGSEQLGMSA